MIRITGAWSTEGFDAPVASWGQRMRQRQADRDIPVPDSVAKSDVTGFCSIQMLEMGAKN